MGLSADAHAHARPRLRALLLIAAVLASATALSRAAPASDTRRSGFADMGPSTQAMQKDDTLNPGMLWVQSGQTLWNQATGQSGKACASCHGDAAQSMRGVATRYPAYDSRLGKPVTLGQRINQCRQTHQQAPAMKAESEEWLGLESYVAHQSRGLPIAPPDDARLAPARQRGQQLFVQRMGQLNLSCAQCHDQNAGGRLGGSVIPQAHPTGYPIYRLEWQGMGSLQRRLRNCMTGVRAEPFAYGTQEMVELELYLAARARGMASEAPAVRP